VRKQVLCQPRQPDELKQQVIAMRKKMRQQLASKPGNPTN